MGTATFKINFGIFIVPLIFYVMYLVKEYRVRLDEFICGSEEYIVVI